mmetsp:Transcript_11769/g.34852  ORF Transcript_11769/g.34852 Transcript_11769/m.34852 type:complete len:143 (+) Transcript_11769:68-496(+)
MVHIINGEILPNDDPRAVALSRGASGDRFDAVQLHLKARPEKKPAPSSPLEAIAQFVGIDGKSVPIPAIPRMGINARQMPLVELLFCIILLGIFPSVVTPAVICAFYVRHAQTEEEIKVMGSAVDDTEGLRAPCGGRFLGRR